MNETEEITGPDRNDNQLINPQNLCQLTLQDHSGRATVYKISIVKPEETKKKGPWKIETKHQDAVDAELIPSLDKIKKKFKKLSDDQRKFVMHIYYVYKNNDSNSEKPRIILHGAAGTGKTTIVLLIDNIITWEENKSSVCPDKLKVLKCTFTGTAARNISGRTFHHALLIPKNRNKDNLEEKLPTLKRKLENVVSLITDDISLVGKTLMTEVNKRLKRIFDNNKLYGNRFVLLVGDLYQLPPVKDKTPYDLELWQCCEFYELTKVFHQYDENLLNALDNSKKSQMTAEDIELIKKREVNEKGVTDPCTHLFHLNDYVDKYNHNKISQSNGHQEEVDAYSSKNKSYRLNVKIGIRYMITKNLNVEDNLANGAIGVVKGFNYDKDGKVEIIWMHFQSPSIGNKTKKDYLEQHKSWPFIDCVPLQQSKMKFYLTSDSDDDDDDANYEEVIGVFPLTAAEAITVYKSQGIIFDKICIHITKDMRDQLQTQKSFLYVALTRVKRIEDIFIINECSIDISSVLNKEDFTTQIELDRLRNERKLKLAYETFEENLNDVIVFLNTASTFNDHHEFISTDKWYDNGSLLIFAETNNIETNIIDIPNFEIAFQSECKTSSTRVLTCYKKASKLVKEIKSKIDDEYDLTLLLYENYLYIISAVKGNYRDDDFKLAINKFIPEDLHDKQCILFIGNCNDISMLTDNFNEHNFKKEIACDASSTNEQSKFDMIFTRNFDIQEDNIGFYEYIPSSHKPIYVKLPLKSASKRCHDGVSSEDNETPDISQQNKKPMMIKVDY